MNSSARTPLEICLNRGPNKDVSYVIARNTETESQQNVDVSAKEYEEFFSDELLSAKDVTIRTQAILFLESKELISEETSQKKEDIQVEEGLIEVAGGE